MACTTVMTVMLAVIGLIAFSGVAAQPAIPSTVSIVKQRQAFGAKEFVYDFNKPETDVTTNGARSRQANSKQMPVLGLLYQQEQIAYELVDLEPCGVKTTHMAANAAEFMVGRLGNFTSGVLKGNKPQVLNSIAKDQATFYPQGMAHFEMNMNCKPAQFMMAIAATAPDADKVVGGQGIAPFNELRAECKSRCAGQVKENSVDLKTAKTVKTAKPAQDASAKKTAKTEKTADVKKSADDKNVKKSADDKKASTQQKSSAADVKKASKQQKASVADDKKASKQKKARAGDDKKASKQQVKSKSNDAKVKQPAKSAAQGKVAGQQVKAAANKKKE